MVLRQSFRGPLGFRTRSTSWLCSLLASLVATLKSFGQSARKHALLAFEFHGCSICTHRLVYYLGVDELFDRHADIVEVLCRKAPTLLPQLFDGLIWRSSKTEHGQRRVNCYIRRALVDTDETDDRVILSSFRALIVHCDPGSTLRLLPTFMLNLLWVRCVHWFFLSTIWFLIALIDYIVGLQ